MAGCNPCCCWKLKDAAVTIGIWSLIYGLASLAMFVWQWGVLSQCRHVTMAQSNLQCEYYCPCVGASTARTSVIVEGLFVIQILCLIASFFLLFSSVMLIYGITTWSRYLVWPWFICMASSILTSLAYCIMWWAGDVRDYWLVLTIIEAFAVFLNCYCFVVICVFYKRMLIELDYYEGRRAQKYNRFNQRETPQNTEQEFDDEEYRGDLTYPAQQAGPSWDGNEWRGARMEPKYPPDPFPHHYLQYPQQQQQQQRYPTTTDFQQKSSYLPQKFEPIGVNESFQKTPIPPIEPLNIERDRPRSAMTAAQSVPSLFDDFRDVPRQEHRKSQRHRSCHCDSHHHDHERQRHHQHDCHHQHRHDHHHHHRRRCRTKSRNHHHHHHGGHHHHQSKRGGESCCSSDVCSTADYSTAESSATSSRYYQNMGTVERRTATASRQFGLLADGEESDELRSAGAYVLKGSMRRHKSVPSDARKSAHRLAAVDKSGRADEPVGDMLRSGSLQRSTPQPDAAAAAAAALGGYGGGISIPQHIVIPPSSLLPDPGNANAERKYQINSEITISYDPRGQQRVVSANSSPNTQKSQGLTQPMSITSNV